jgi:hypothetical protein
MFSTLLDFDLSIVSFIKIFKCTSKKNQKANGKFPLLKFNRKQMGYIYERESRTRDSKEKIRLSVFEYAFHYWMGSLKRFKKSSLLSSPYISFFSMPQQGILSAPIERKKRRKVTSIDSFRPNSSPSHFFVSCSSPRWFSRFVQVRNLKQLWNLLHFLLRVHKTHDEWSIFERYVFSLHFFKCSVWLNCFSRWGGGRGKR